MSPPKSTIWITTTPRIWRCPLLSTTIRLKNCVLLRPTIPVQMHLAPSNTVSCLQQWPQVPTQRQLRTEHAYVIAFLLTSGSEDFMRLHGNSKSNSNPEKKGCNFFQSIISRGKREFRMMMEKPTALVQTHCTGANPLVSSSAKMSWKLQNDDSMLQR